MQLEKVTNSLLQEVLDFIGCDQYSNFTQTAQKIWNLNVGTSLSVNGYTIAMAGKSRAGKYLVL